MESDTTEASASTPVIAAEAESAWPAYRLWPAAGHRSAKRPQTVSIDALADASAIDVPAPGGEGRETAVAVMDREPATPALDRALADIEKPGDSTERLPILAETSPAPAAEDVVLAVWTAPATSDAAADDVPVAQRWAMRPESERVPQDRDEPFESFSACPGFDPENPWAAVRKYEGNALAVLDELFRAIDRRAAGRNPIPLLETPPSSLDQARALAELAELQRRGMVGDADARKRRERLLALGDVSVRLRTLVELHAAGYLSDAELGQKRKRLIDGLSISLVRM
jgi:hypothetical protein